MSSAVMIRKFGLLFAASDDGTAGKAAAMTSNAILAAPWKRESGLLLMIS